MANVKPFLMDGVEYNVHVMDLARSFEVMETNLSGRTQDGQMYRDLVGTFYHYSMRIAQRDNDTAAMDAFWDAISNPQISHVCTFPYNQSTMTQRMYVKTGRQDIRRLKESRTEWGDIVIEFVAMAPRVTP